MRHVLARRTSARWERQCQLHGKLSPLASMPALLLAEVHYEQNRLSQARALIADYLHIAHGLGYVDKLIAAYVTKARLEAIDGQYEIAQQTLDEGDRCARVTGFVRLQANVLCERMRQTADVRQCSRGHRPRAAGRPARELRNAPTVRRCDIGYGAPRDFVGVRGAREWRYRWSDPPAQELVSLRNGATMPSVGSAPGTGARDAVPAPR